MCPGKTKLPTSCFLFFSLLAFLSSLLYHSPGLLQVTVCRVCTLRVQFCLRHHRGTRPPYRVCQPVRMQPLFFSSWSRRCREDRDRQMRKQSTCIKRERARQSASWYPCLRISLSNVYVVAFYVRRQRGLRRFQRRGGRSSSFSVANPEGSSVHTLVCWLFCAF